MFNFPNVFQKLIRNDDKLYAHFTDSEKKKFLNSFIERIEIYPEEQPDGRLIRSIRFKFPVWFGEGYTSDLSWDNETTVSSMAFLPANPTNTPALQTDPIRRRSRRR